MTKTHLILAVVVDGTSRIAAEPRSGTAVLDREPLDQDQEAREPLEDPKVPGDLHIQVEADVASIQGDDHLPESVTQRMQVRNMDTRRNAILVAKMERS